VGEVTNVLKKVRRLEITSKKLVDGLMQGEYRSIFKGRGIEFSEVREYQIGDDVRTIDWNVSARMNRPFVKEFIEERDLSIIVLFDISESNSFGTNERIKKDIGLEIGATLLYSALKNNDRIGLLLSTEVVEKFIPPAKGKKHFLRILREMVNSQRKFKGTNLAPSVEYLNKILKKRTIIFLISDFMDDLEKLSKPLRILRYRHDVIAIKISDPRELDIPNVGLVELEDAETGEQILVDTSDPEFIKAFSQKIEEDKRILSHLMKKNKIDLINVTSGKEWVKDIKMFFEKRKRRTRWV